MVKFSKIAALAGSAMVFAGMAFGQATCAAPTATTNIIRAEGTTEQVAQLTFVCTSPAAIGTAGAASVQVFLSPALPVTSKVLNTTPTTEALIQVNGAAPAAAGSAQGSVSGSTINFSGVALPALAAANCGVNFCYTFVISNVRVNATSLSVGSGVPPAVSETVFISGSAANIVPAALASTQVAFAQNGLGTASLFKTFTNGAGAAGTATGYPVGTGSSAGANNFVICNAYSPRIDVNGGVPASISGAGVVQGRSLAFAVRVNENFASAFKMVGGFSANGVAPTSIPPGGAVPLGPTSIEQSQIAVTSGSGNAVVDGTRFQVNFTNVPANVTLFVPNGLMTSTNGSAATAQLTASAPGTAFAAVTGSSSSSVTGGATGFGTGAGNSLAAVTISGGSGSAVFEVLTADPNNLDRFDIPVFAVTTANSVAGSSTPIGVSVSFNPVGSTVIPNFAVGGSTTTLTGSTFNLCTTSLLFPFVTNQLGFDTGLAIANTSTDPFGGLGATAQAGTCTLNFYGNGAPSPANVATPNVPTGTVYTQVLSGVAAGFQGYMIAQCNFQYAHGFAFITDGVGANGGLSQGYLAGVIPDVNQIAGGRPANPGTAAPAGTGETLGN